MDDWNAFTESIPWFVDASMKIRLSGTRLGLLLPPSLPLIFPSLSQLLSSARVTPLLVNEVPHQLLAWDRINGERMGWLCLSPTASIPNCVHADHAELLGSFGGIVEHFNDPDATWLMNHNDVLTGLEASYDANFLNDYSWAFENVGLQCPIRTCDYYSLAREANGNTTLCHRETGQVLLFAPDHAFDFVIPFDDCPEYTLYTIKGAATLRDWVESIARQWLSNTKQPK